MKAGSTPNVVVGMGDYVYEVVRPWGTLPTGMHFGWIHSVAVDSRNRVYFCQRADPPVLVFDSDGNFLTGWGEGRLLDPHGIYIGPDDHIYVCDRDHHEVLKFTPEGKVTLSLGHRDKPALQAPFNHPTDVAVSPSGDIYVTDGYGNSAIHRFSPEGKHLLSWGTHGAGSGQLTTPHGIWVDSANRVLVADRENHRIQIFSPEGDFCGEWGDLYRPQDIYVGPKGTIYVTDQIPRLTVYSAEGRLLARGRPPIDGGPHSLWGDSDGSLYMAEVRQPQVAKLVKRAPSAASL